MRDRRSLAVRRADPNRIVAPKTVCYTYSEITTGSFARILRALQGDLD